MGIKDAIRAVRNGRLRAWLAEDCRRTALRNEGGDIPAAKRVCLAFEIYWKAVAGLILSGAGVALWRGIEVGLIEALGLMGAAGIVWAYGEANAEAAGLLRCPEPGRPVFYDLKMEEF